METLKYQIFGDEWLIKARSNSGDASWVNEVVEHLDTSGSIYLGTLRLWFDAFPSTADDKQMLCGRLESFQDEQHLGGVNELAWWALMRREGVGVSAVPTAKTPRPDFKLESPLDCFVEVSTLNVSASDKCKKRTGKSVALDHRETIRRAIGKLTNEKHRQLVYATKERKPSVLVLFDYTEWSAFGTDFVETLGEFLLGKGFGFKDVPPQLSALVWLERKVLDGRIALSGDRSAIYYNPLAVQSLSFGSFPFLRQFWSQIVSSEPVRPDRWYCL